MFNGSLFRFFRNEIYVTDVFGDLYRIVLSETPGNFGVIQLIKKRDYEKDIDQLAFEYELKSFNNV
jgi:hypothetical protein